jgi:aminoglycoside phosphotransferase (APT) family kinase protein
VLRRTPTLLGRLPRLTTDTQLTLHQVDAAPLIDALGERSAGVGRWLDLLESQVTSGASGLAAGWRWLVDNRPMPPPGPVLCHGDVWGGNMLFEGSRLTGVIDWTLATAAEPALEVGFTMMSLTLAPLPVPRAVRSAVRVVSRWLAQRYSRRYRRGTDADLSAVPYYEALRCAIELCGVAAYRAAVASGVSDDSPRPPCDSVVDDMIGYFRTRSGVELSVPLSGHPEPPSPPEAVAIEDAFDKLRHRASG